MVFFHPDFFLPKPVPKRFFYNLSYIFNFEWFWKIIKRSLFHCAYSRINITESGKHYNENIGFDSFALNSISNPSISGSRMSKSITSGCSFSTVSMQFYRFLLQKENNLFARIFITTFLIPGSSSTIKIFGSAMHPPFTLMLSAIESFYFTFDFFRFSFWKNNCYRCPLFFYTLYTYMAPCSITFLLTIERQAFLSFL